MPIMWLSKLIEHLNAFPECLQDIINRLRQIHLDALLWPGVPCIIRYDVYCCCCCCTETWKRRRRLVEHRSSNLLRASDISNYDLASSEAYWVSLSYGLSTIYFEVMARRPINRLAVLSGLQSSNWQQATHFISRRCSKLNSRWIWPAYWWRR